MVDALLVVVVVYAVIVICDGGGLVVDLVELAIGRDVIFGWAVPHLFGCVRHVVVYVFGIVRVYVILVSADRVGRDARVTDYYF